MIPSVQRTVAEHRVRGTSFELSDHKTVSDRPHSGGVMYTMYHKDHIINTSLHHKTVSDRDPECAAHGREAPCAMYLI